MSLNKSKKNFYVYEWFNVDTNEVFYVGKGRNDRFKNITQRNNYFKNYYNKYKCDVRKVVHSLLENEAFELEKELIEKYRQIGQCQCNLTDGGEGCTFPEDSWNHMFRKLQYHHDVRGDMDNMINEHDYRAENLKTKSIEELNDLYEKYKDYKDGIKTARDLGLIKLLNGFEMKIQYEEIVMLTDLISTEIAKSNKAFKKFLNYKTEIDFICSDFDSDKFISLILKNTDYTFELGKCIADNMRLLKQIYNEPNININIKIKSYEFIDNKIFIRCNTKDDNKIRMIEIDVYDIIWGILMYKFKKPLFEIIYDEMMVAPIIN